MAFDCGFFDSTSAVVVNGFCQGNKAKNAEFLADYFASFIGNGVYPNPSSNFLVSSANSGMTVNVAPGKAYINGYYCRNDEIDTQTFITDSAAHTYYFVLRLNIGLGEIVPLWYTDPDLTLFPTRTSYVHELVLAKVTVPAYTTTINNSMISDLRYDSGMCGIVAAVVKNIDTTHLYQQITAFINNMSDFIDREQQNILDWEADSQEQFDVWFSAIKAQLDDNVVTRLEQQKADRMYLVCTTSADSTAKTVSFTNYTTNVGQYMVVKFVNSVKGGSSLKIENTSAYPITENMEPIQFDRINAGDTVLLVFTGTSYDMLNLKGGRRSSRKQIFTESGSFDVSDKNEVYISACGAGGTNGTAGGYIYRERYDVSSIDTITFTVGMGATTINLGYIVIPLSKGGAKNNMPNTLLGYPAGYNGGNSVSSATPNTTIYAHGGYGGLLGYGGGAGGANADSTSNHMGGGGGGCDIPTMTGANGANGLYENTTANGAGGGTTGGNGGARLVNGEPVGLNASGGLYVTSGSSGASATNGGGRGTRLGAGGGGADINGSTLPGGGGGAGGYGAGGGWGYNDIYGDPTGGCVIFEWGDIPTNDKVTFNEVRITSNEAFTVPTDVDALYITACAAGISPYAGEWIEDYYLRVTTGQQIPIVVGAGNTVINNNITLIAGATTASRPCDKLGYMTGYDGVRDYIMFSGNTRIVPNNLNAAGYGGLLGYGGGVGGIHYVEKTASGAMQNLFSGSAGGGNNGVGINEVGYSLGNITNEFNVVPARELTNNGGKGGNSYGYTSASYSLANMHGGDSPGSTFSLKYNGGASVNSNGKGGNGGLYGAGGGGGVRSYSVTEMNNFAANSTNYKRGSGGGAGGYGAGGGDGQNKGTASPGIVIIRYVRRSAV